MSQRYESWSPDALEAARSAEAGVGARRARIGYWVLGAGWAPILSALVAFFLLGDMRNATLAAVAITAAAGGPVVGLGSWILLRTVNWRSGVPGLFAGCAAGALLLVGIMLNGEEGRKDREWCRVDAVARETRDNSHFSYRYRLACASAPREIVDRPKSSSAEPSTIYRTGQRVAVSHDLVYERWRIEPSDDKYFPFVLIGGVVMATALSATTVVSRRRHVRRGRRP
ncbi:hypothetical protein [Actinomadura terrae]|uniref:hypothetical protein n=1 Tax=Actinomadura terrae TaxID=604353 RepID=UPI001FA708C4|nr:hypothetical protein [Actinomadura terrae]